MYAPGQTEALSDWIDGSVHPTLVGVYQRDYRGTRSKVAAFAYALWDGTHWHSNEKTAEAAACNPTLSAFQQIPWRGLRFRLGSPVSQGHAS